VIKAIIAIEYDINKKAKNLKAPVFCCHKCVTYGSIKIAKLIPVGNNQFRE
jgi:hypothetical protein